MIHTDQQGGNKTTYKCFPELDFVFFFIWEFVLIAELCTLNRIFSVVQTKNKSLYEIYFIIVFLVLFCNIQKLFLLAILQQNYFSWSKDYF